MIVPLVAEGKAAAVGVDQRRKRAVARLGQKDVQALVGALLGVRHVQRLAGDAVDLRHPRLVLRPGCGRIAPLM